MAVTPIADLAPTSGGDFAVRNGATFLLCARGDDGILTFPAGVDVERVEVGPDGVLYSFSTVYVSASMQVPYTIGYVDFPGDVRVLASLRGPANAWRCDGAVRLSNEGSEWFVEPAEHRS